MTRRNILQGMLLMLGADVAFAAMAAATQFTGRGVSSWQIIFIRSLVSTLILWLWLTLKKVPLTGREPGLLWARGIIGYTALQCYFWALPQLPLGTAIMLNYTAPIFAVILSYWLLRERPGLTSVFSLLLSFAGLFVMSQPSWSDRPWAILAGMMSGILAGLVHVLIRRGNRTDDPLLIIFYFTVSSTVGSGILCLTLGWTRPDAAQWTGLALLTLTSFAGQLCLTHSLQKAPVWAASPLGFLTPVMGLGLGSYLWGQQAGVQEIAGASLIIAGGAYLVFDFYFRKK